jgi:hypothetical protein
MLPSFRRPSSSAVLVLSLLASASACSGLAREDVTDAGTSSSSGGSSSGGSSSGSSGGSRSGPVLTVPPPPPSGSSSGGPTSPPDPLPESGPYSDDETGPPIGVGPEPGDCGCGDEWQPVFDAPPPPPSMEPVVPFAPQTPVKVAGACSAFSLVPPEPFVAAKPDVNASVAQILGTTKASMTGSWIGSVASPWPPNWYVTLTFEPDGHYLAMGYNPSLPPPNPLAFYYGTNNDTDPTCVQDRQWRLDGISSDLTVSGQIDIPFWYYPGCALPAWHGVLSGMAFDATGDRMQFSFETSDGYGPIIYDLWRVCDVGESIDGGFDG